jgi:hypothetical protein
MLLIETQQVDSINADGGFQAASAAKWLSRLDPKPKYRDFDTGRPSGKCVTIRNQDGNTQSQAQAWSQGDRESGTLLPIAACAVDVHIRSGATTKARQAPRRQLHWQVVVLRGVIDAESEQCDIEERHCGYGDAGVAVEVGHAESSFIPAGFEPRRQRGVVECAVHRNRPGTEPSWRIDGVHFYLHAGSDHAPRDIDDMNGHSWHGDILRNRHR